MCINLISIMFNYFHIQCFMIKIHTASNVSKHNRTNSVSKIIQIGKQ